MGILECTHFSEWFGYNHTRWVCVPDIILEVNRKSSQDEKIIWNKCISSSFFLPGKSWDTNNCSQESENFSLAIKKIFQATINFLKWSSPYLVFYSWSERGQEVHWCDLSLWGWSAGGGSQGGSHCLKPLPCLLVIQEDLRIVIFLIIFQESRILFRNLLLSFTFLLPTCQCQHIFCSWVEPSLLLSS